MLQFELRDSAHVKSFSPTGRDENSVEVAVIGFGPTGALAANLLGQAGLRTLCVERTTEVYDKPRAIAMDHEILRVFDNVGVADKIAPFIAPFDLSEHFGAQGQLLRRIGMVGGPYPLGYTPTMVFTQPPVERALREQAATWPFVEVALGTEVAELTQNSDRVTLTLRGPDGSTRRVEANYAIACDGASSSIRQQLGIPLDDLEFDEPWTVVDILVNEDKLHLVPRHSAHFCDPERPTAYIVGPGNHRRWEIMLSEGDDPREMEQPENIWRLLKGWIGPDDAKIWRASSYRFHALVARNWRQGRVFLAGDAAHQQPPILGQGMCQGMRDVANLTWKLASVLHGKAPSRLLDTYGQERDAHVRELIASIKQIGEVLCERDLAAAERRDVRILAESGGAPKTITRQSIIPRIREGALMPETGAAVGGLFPQPLIESPSGWRLLDSVWGCGWRIVIDSRRTPRIPPEVIAAGKGMECRLLKLASAGSDMDPHSSEVILFKEKEHILADWFDRYQVAAAVIRPDHYVFATANDADMLLPILSTVSKWLLTGGDVVEVVTT